MAIKFRTQILILLSILIPMQVNAADTGYLIRSDLWIRAVIQTEEKGPADALWYKGGESNTTAGDHVVWGYFYANPSDVTWGSSQNPDMFVKIWFDHSGRTDVNFFHVSVPDIEVYSDYPYDGVSDAHTTATMSRRYIRQYYEEGQTRLDTQHEDGEPPSAFMYWPMGNPGGHPTRTGILIASVINTEEKGSVEAIWRKGGSGITEGGHGVSWGYFYADPKDVSWGNENNPDLFVKIWEDASGRTDVNFFHVSVPDIEVYSDHPDDDTYVQKGTTILDNRYIRHEYQIAPFCTVEKKNQFVHEIMRDSYLWYDQVPKHVDYIAYASPEDLLDELMYTELDRWSYIVSIEENYEFTEGKYIGLGFNADYDTGRVRYVYQGSPANAAGMKRSDKILEINGKTMDEIRENDLESTISGDDAVGVAVALKTEDSEGVVREFTAKKDQVDVSAILHYEVLEKNSRKIGYLVFDTFIEGAIAELDTVFAYFRQQAVDELILDMRYNRGGYAYVAEYLASLIGGIHVAGKMFEKSVHNDKYSVLDRVRYFSDPVNENALSLNRVICITTDSTCSASELLINSLKPFLSVVQIGETTCGKPVGMYGADFCDIHISPIEVQSVNANDEGDYFDGIPPTCHADDDLTRVFGDSLESSLRSALHYADTGACLNPSKAVRTRPLKKSRRTRFIHQFGKEFGTF